MKKTILCTVFLLCIISVNTQNRYNKILDRYEEEVMNFSCIYNKARSGSITRTQAEEQTRSLYERLTIIQQELAAASENITLSQKIRLKNISDYMDMIETYDSSGADPLAEKLLKEYEMALYDMVDFIENMTNNNKMGENAIRRQFIKKTNKIESLLLSLDNVEAFMSDYQYARWQMLQNEEEVFATTLIVGWYTEN